MHRPISLLVAITLLAACERPVERTADREFAAKVLAGVLAFPQSALVGVSAGEDAAEATFSTPGELKVVAAWYRDNLPLNGWRVRADQTMPDGSITLAADSGRRPLWIRLRANVGAPGTTYTLVGALPSADTSRAGAQRSGSSMSSNRIQRR